MVLFGPGDELSCCPDEDRVKASTCLGAWVLGCSVMGFK